MKQKTKQLGNAVTQFIGDFLEDIFVVIGMLFIVVAIFMMFGVAHALFIAGVFFILIGVLDPHAHKKKDGET